MLLLGPGALQARWPALAARQKTVVGIKRDSAPLNRARICNLRISGAGLRLPGQWLRLRASTASPGGGAGRADGGDPVDNESPAADQVQEPVTPRDQQDGSPELVASTSSADDEEGAGGGWSLRRAVAPALELASAIAAAAAAAWRRWYLRLPLLIGGWVIAFGVALGLVLTPVLNAFVVPAIEGRAAEALQRDVSIGRVSHVSLVGGLMGLRPIIALKDIAVGPGPVERSSAEVGVVSLSFAPLQSMLRGEAVLSVDVGRASVRAVQAYNLSWVGFPQDPVPSARDWLPGLADTTPQQQEEDDESGGAAADDSDEGGTSADGGGGGGNGGDDGTPAQAGGLVSVSVPSLPIGGRRPSPPLASLSAPQPPRRGNEATASTAVDAAPSSAAATKLAPRHSGDAPQDDAVALAERRASHATAGPSTTEEPDLEAALRWRWRRRDNGERAARRAAQLPPGQEGIRLLGHRFALAPPPPPLELTLPPVTELELGPSPQQQHEENVKQQQQQQQVKEEEGTQEQWQQQALRQHRQRHEQQQQQEEQRRGEDEPGQQQQASRPWWALRSHPIKSARDMWSGSSSGEGAESGNATVSEDLATTPSGEEPQVVPLASTQSNSAFQVPVANTVPEGAKDDTPAPADKSPSTPAAPESTATTPEPVRPQLVVQPYVQSSRPTAGSIVGRFLADRLSEAGAHLASAFGGVATRLGEAVAARLPPIHLSRVNLTDSRLFAVVWGEPIPRIIEDINATVRLAPGYSRFELDLDAVPRARDPRSVKCTVISPHSKRHLRHVTPGTVPAGVGPLRSFTCDVLPDRGSAASEVTAATAAATAANDTSGSDVLDSAWSSEQLQQEEGDGEQQQEGSRRKNNQWQPRQQQQQWIQDQALVQDQSVEGNQQGDGATTIGPYSTPEPMFLGPSGGANLPHTVHFQTQLPPGQEGSPLPAPGSGGRLGLRVRHTWPSEPGGSMDLQVTVIGRKLHAPLIERLIDLPMDIHAGTADGELHLRSHDPATWEFPAITGKIVCSDGDLHFWDAPDDILDTNMDLVFEGDRVYLHNAKGYFGAVPLRVSGDLDLNPRGGSYRLQANVPAVEIAALRTTLAVRPIPFPMAGAVRGVLHCTGPLEKPIFSGSVTAVRPTPAMLAGCEDTPALRVLLNDPSAVVAYDRVPASAAGGVFTLDLSTEMFVLHSGQAVPAGGGLIVATGKMWVAPAAESDPRAISMQGMGEGLSPAALAAGYLPPGTPPPPALASVGPLNARGSLEGSHLAPVTRAQWLAPLSGVGGSATFSPTRIAGELTGPAFTLRATADISAPHADKARAADTQAEATYWGQPRVEGVELDGTLAGADVSQLMSAPPPTAAAPLQQPGQQGAAPGEGTGGALMAVQQQLQQQLGAARPAGVAGSTGGGSGLLLPSGRADALQQQLGASSTSGGSGGVLPVGGPNPVKLRLSGRLRLSAKRLEGDAARRQQRGAAGEVGVGSSPYLFTGPVVMEGLRLNQLSLARSLAGDVALTEPRLLLKARGPRADELMELDLALPLPADRGGPGLDGRVPAPIYWPEGYHPADRQQRGALEATAPGAPPLLPLGALDDRRLGGGRSVRGAGSFGGDAYPTNYSGGRGGGRRDEDAEQRVSHVLLRRGGLYLSSTVNQRCSQVALAAEGLPLDELELGSLRGRLTAAALDIDLGARQGRASFSVAAPRFSGLRGTSASASARWERDVVLIERATLTQAASRYEVQAEYVLPPGLKLPESFAPEPQPSVAADNGADGLTGGVPGGDGSQAVVDGEEEGRWRVMLTVPGARIEELLPAGQLLQQATRRAAALDPFAAKRRFLGELSHAVCTAAQEFRYQVDALLAAEHTAEVAARGAGAASDASSLADGATSPLSLPGLQELRGGWEGSVTAVGGGGGEPRVDFDLKGAGWRWGDYTLDALVLRGAAHGSEGLALEELKLASAGATLAAGGQLLGPRQDATIELDHLPAALLSPLYRALPALQHAAPAVDIREALGAAAPGPGGGLMQQLGLASLGTRLEQRLASLGIHLPGPKGAGNEDPLAPFMESPVSGLLYLRGSLGGSIDAPSGAVSLKLVDGAVGRARLAKAVASLALSPDQVLSIDVEVAPADGPGHVKLGGTIPLPKATGPATVTAPATPPATQAQQQQTPVSEASAEAVEDDTPAAGGGVPDTLPGEVDLSLLVRDGGVDLAGSLVPGFRWEGGLANISMRVAGPLNAPRVTGGATFSRGVVMVDGVLRSPLVGISGSLELDGTVLRARTLEARSGRAGVIRLSGAIPLRPLAPGQIPLPAVSSDGGDREPSPSEGLLAEASGLELRVRNAYSGLLDAAVRVGGSLAAPVVGGELRMSRGTVYLVGQAGGNPAGSPAAPSTGDPLSTATPTTGRGAEADMVSRAFSALKAGRRRAQDQAALALAPLGTSPPPLLQPLPRDQATSQEEEDAHPQQNDQTQEDQRGGDAAVDESAPDVLLSGLQITLGPELRAFFPVVVNVGVSGTLSVSGRPAEPGGLRVAGAIRLDNGTLNLVATQFVVERAHANTLTFSPEAGLDPALDIALNSAELRALIQGRASNWHEHVTLSYGAGGGPGAPGGGAGVGAATTGVGATAEAGDVLGANEVARLFEGRLAGALVGEDGSLSLAALASSTISSLLPKIETQGVIGRARWRLVSAPTLPNLLAVEAQAQNSGGGGAAWLRSLALGTEVELALGRRLVAALSHTTQRPDDALEMRVSLALTRQLRLLMLHNAGAARTASVLLQFSSSTANTGG